MGLEGMLHSMRAWGLGDYGVIEMEWAEKAQKVLGAKE